MLYSHTAKLAVWWKTKFSVYTIDIVHRSAATMTDQIDSHDLNNTMIINLWQIRYTHYSVIPMQLLYYAGKNPNLSTTIAPGWVLSTKQQKLIVGFNHLLGFWYEKFSVIIKYLYQQYSYQHKSTAYVLSINKTNPIQCFQHFSRSKI